MNMKPISTMYEGVFYRSRNEVRWAILFDLIGLRYQYEPEGLDVIPGLPYLPDFFLPDFGISLEVKPKDISEKDQNRLNYILASWKDDTKFGSLWLLRGVHSPDGHQIRIHESRSVCRFAKCTRCNTVCFVGDDCWGSLAKPDSECYLTHDRLPEYFYEREFDVAATYDFSRSKHFNNRKPDMPELSDVPAETW